MKQLFILLAALLIAAGVQAQEQEQHFRFGIKAGAQVAQLRGQNLDSISANGESKGQPGLLLGLSAESPVSRYFLLKHDIFFSSRRITLKNADGSDAPLRRSNIDIFPISPTLHYKGLEIFAGPYASILVSTKLNGNDYFGNGTTDRGYSQKTDFGFTTGAGYTLKEHWHIEFRYVHGLQSMVENPAVHQQLKIYNRYMGLTLGYWF
ncbi:porin family protein [Chitinophaga vietnamensis]|uniref:porin family protein n=1 Tax=Chitinophaga vietnamensis TaxID=2593957 RepID=UPI001178763F|nr:porin family protein [Chitinophaga vietnamensis]